jgi:hypothetical protein
MYEHASGVAEKALLFRHVTGITLTVVSVRTQIPLPTWLHRLAQGLPPE